MTEHVASRPRLARRFRLLRPYAPRVAAGYALLLVTSLFQLFYPKAIGAFIDRAVAPTASSWLLWMSLGMAALLLVHAVAIAARHYLFASTGSLVVADLRNAFFGAVVQQDIGFFDAQNSGELTNRLSNDVEHLQEALTVDAAMLAQTALIGIGAAAMLLVISPQLSLLIVVIAPLVTFSMRWVGSRSRKLARMKQEQLAYCARLAQEVFGNIRLVHAFTREGHERGKFAAATREALDYALSGDRLFSGLEGGATFVQSIALLVTVLVGGTLVSRNELSLGELTGFILYAGMAAGSATSLGGLWGEWMRAIGATDRVFELLDAAPAAESRSSSRVVLSAAASTGQDAVPARARLDGPIRFDAVGFAYPTRPGQPALTDFSLDIRPGEKIALVGGSGAGKSTVVNLLLGFYVPTHGAIRIDGIDLRELDRTQVRHQIAIVEQEPALFSSSILDNIRYGAATHEVEDAAVFEAARQAHVDEFALRFPDGYDTRVGTRGLQLSGGQKQRVAIARALLRDPRLLVLDEATSALDSESEGKVQDALRRTMEGRTTIIIAHRLSTIAFADRVVVMRAGRIVECGAHCELMEERDGYYRRLVSGQMLDVSGKPVVATDAPVTLA